MNFMKRKHGTANQVSDADGIAMGKGHKVGSVGSNMPTSQRADATL
jgi:hypothetical protein